MFVARNPGSAKPAGPGNTGAAGWTWQLAVEGILGLTLVNGGGQDQAMSAQALGKSGKPKSGAPKESSPSPIENPDGLGGGRIPAHGRRP